jgi:HNH endonuclease
MSVSYPVKIQVWAAAAGRCCKCKMILIKEPNDDQAHFTIGEVAHIHGEHVGAKRFRHEFSEEQTNSFPNLMLMCPNHHTEIDRDDVTYTVDVLKRMKVEHEDWIKKQLSIAAFNTSFAELEVVLKYLSSASIDTTQVDFRVITPSEKILKNNLSNSIAGYITMGMIKSELVKDYLNRNPDINFANRLRKGFVDYYFELKGKMNGDELFYSLLAFASGSSSEFSVQAAALAVIVYFFQICDIFES